MRDDVCADHRAGRKSGYTRTSSKKRSIVVASLPTTVNLQDTASLWTATPSSTRPLRSPARLADVDDAAFFPFGSSSFTPPHLRSMGEVENGRSMDQGVFLTWEDLWVSAPGRKGGRVSILCGITGFARPDCRLIVEARKQEIQEREEDKGRKDYSQSFKSQAFNGKKSEKFNSEKIISLAYARIQGRAALVAHFQNSSLMNEDTR
ncbi:hypothetical protein B296_00004455 [Ensete ventricosum]|uniref:Mei2-like C-terminal RNA recognition motif domain-containing protein n=1 Tax=Ensete ventricosum TaxID=4639 RepID=A0A427AAZ8_ENSVE|nr:hypothetical protein B296_00004455 [Ensete ventricosum]